MPASSPAHAEIGQFPHTRPTFRTERFTLLPVNPAKLRQLMEILLQDEPLAAALPWMTDKSADGARREAFLIELEAAADSLRGWGIVEHASRTFVGAVLARKSLEGVDLEVMCPSHYWDQGISDEVGPQVLQWVEDNMEVELVFRQ